MNVVLDTSIIIPYLGNVAYEHFVWWRLARRQVYVSEASAMELLAGSTSKEQRIKAEAMLHRLDADGRVLTPLSEEWRRAGLFVARYQSLRGHLKPGEHVADILILLTAARSGAELVTENGAHFQLWAEFLAQPRRPLLTVLKRQEHFNRS
ncbi:MAG: PIN domain-containing protein [Actinobacteria bacterium]|nr:PIN domain-containing protein [Actinomycetota bacterium]